MKFVKGQISGCGKSGRTAEQMAGSSSDGASGHSEGQRVSALEQLKKGPVTVSGLRLMRRWNDISDYEVLSFPDELFRSACHSTA